MRPRTPPAPRGDYKRLSLPGIPKYSDVLEALSRKGKTRLLFHRLRFRILQGVSLRCLAAPLFCFVASCGQAPRKNQRPGPIRGNAGAGRISPRNPSEISGDKQLLHLGLARQFIKDRRSTADLQSWGAAIRDFCSGKPGVSMVTRYTEPPRFGAV